MIAQLTQNWLCWGIVLLALVCYQQLLLSLLQLKVLKQTGIISSTKATENCSKLEFSSVLIGVLPLMGLLGTIIGLLDCFSGMASGGASAEMVSGGIGDALLTTQLGLVCAIPGWLLQAWVRASRKRIAPAELIMAG